MIYQNVWVIFFDRYIKSHNDKIEDFMMDKSCTEL